MTIQDRDLKAGTRLVARYKGQEYSATVVEGEEGGIRYRLEDGREFKSPSSAGSAVMGGSACNGWRFWSVAGGADTVAEAPKKKTKRGANPGNGLIQRMEDGRYFCSACMEAFDAPAGVEPLGCPQGHRPGQPEAASL